MEKSLIPWLYRPRTTVKNARSMKSVSRAKLAYFKGIFKLWTHDQQKLPYFERIFKLFTHDQQDLPFLQMFISFANKNLAVLCVKLPWNGFRFPWYFWCCRRSIWYVEYEFLPVVKVMMILTFAGKSLGIHEVDPFWWELTKNISIASEIVQKWLVSSVFESYWKRISKCFTIDKWKSFVE